MRTNLLIAASFLIVLILQLIPYRTSVGDIIFIYSYGNLPDLYIFFIICFLLLLATIVLTQFTFRQVLFGQLIIKRRNFNIKQQLAGIPFWVVFVVTSGFLSNNYLYYLKGTTPYFFIILGTVITYHFFAKWIVLKYKPDFLSISDDNIFYKSLWGNGKRKIDNLQSVGYNANQNAITLNFKEGLDNIQLHLTDYEINDILNLIRIIKQTSTNSLQIAESFNKYFPTAI